MTNKVAIDVESKGAKEAAKEVGSVKDAWTAFQKEGAKGLGIGIGAGLTMKALDRIGSAADTAASAVIGFATDSIAKASDLNETMQKAEVIFGDNSKAVEDWAGTMDKAGGQSKQAALDAASGFAGLFKTVGISIDQATPMSEKLTQMGADLASFFNTDVNTALEALKSGLDGEAKPLRQFNIFLSETAVSAKLAQMGVQKVGGEFTEAQKATARYQLILEQTKDAHGDYARTSDGLANSQRTLTAEMDNLQAEVGQDLLPVLKDMTKWARDDGVPALKDLIQEAKDAAPIFGALGVASKIFVSKDNAKAGVEFGQMLHDIIFGVQDLTSAQDLANISFRQGEHDFDNASTSAWTFGHATDGAAQHAEALNKGQLALSGSANALHHAYAPVLVDLRSLNRSSTTPRRRSRTTCSRSTASSGRCKRAGTRSRTTSTTSRSSRRSSTRRAPSARTSTPPRTRSSTTRNRSSTPRSSCWDGEDHLPEPRQATHRASASISWPTPTRRGCCARTAGQADRRLGGRAGSGGHHGGGAGGTGVHATPPPPPNDHGHAAGGNETKGMPRLVGEKGPELFTPESNGHTTPNANTMLGAEGVPRGTGAASLTINGGIHLHGIGSDVSPAAAEHFGRRVLSEVAAGFKQGSARRGISVAVRP
jgi:hypothetical protein